MMKLIFHSEAETKNAEEELEKATKNLKSISTEDLKHITGFKQIYYNQKVI